MKESLIICTVWLLLNAVWDATRLNKFKGVSHKANAILYCATVGGVCWWFNTWWFIPGFLSYRFLLFNNSLNLLRHRELTYVPANPTSWVDQIVQKTFKKHIWERSNLFFLSVFALNWFTPVIVKWCNW